jgi:Kef-type K+ transport system membrane component KefB
METTPSVLSAPDHAQTLLALFVALLAAKVLAEIFERLRQPAVVGEILAGILIGPAVLNWVKPTNELETLAELGVIFLLFTVGLETRPSDIFSVGGIAFLSAVLGVIIPFACGWLLLSFWPGYNGVEAIFLGAAMVATSVGITARVLSGAGLIAAKASRVILAAAVIDDVIGLLGLALVSSVAEGHLNYWRLALTGVLAAAFTILAITFGARVISRVKQPVAGLKINHSIFVFALILCFGLAAAASYIGIAGIIGAFLAGVALSEATDGTSLHQHAESLSEFLAPFFLVSIGMKLDLSVFLSKGVILLAAVVILLAVVSKLVGCGLGSLSLGRRPALQVGIGMLPRGEVGIVVAQIGLGITGNQTLYGIVIIMAIATTLIAPPFVRLAFKNEKVATAAAVLVEELEHDIG